MSTTPHVLVLNAGSSSLKFAVYDDQEPARPLLSGSAPLTGSHVTAALDALLARVAATGEPGFAAVGHRIVHGGPRFTAPQLITENLLDALRELSPFDPEHLPTEIALIEELQRRFPAIPQIACFDTAFHRDLPLVAQLLPIPRRYFAAGVRRYGFHGLSYEYLLGELARLGEPSATKGRVIFAHLGNGASLAAVRDGQCIDTSMGFTPAAGLVMGTRTGDLDPGVMAYLAQTENMSAAQFSHLVNHDSGLLGVSETSADMRELLAAEPADSRAAEAIALFCYQVKKWIGSFTAALGGLDTLVFSGGMGENCPTIRDRICDGLGFLGVEIDDAHNEENADVISLPAGRVAVRVIATNEELMIARHVRAVTATEPPTPAPL